MRFLGDMRSHFGDGTTDWLSENEFSFMTFIRGFKFSTALGEGMSTLLLLPGDINFFKSLISPYWEVNWLWPVCIALLKQLVFCVVFLITA